MLVSPYRTPAIVPPAEHPRLMLRSSDLPRIRKNLSLPENAFAAGVCGELLRTEITGRGATPEYGPYDLAEVLACEARAFRALLTGERDDARRAVGSILFLLEGFSVTGGNMGARWGGHLIFTAAEVYDWCYRFIDAGEKEKIIALCEDIAARYFEMKYPPSGQTALTGHGTEAQLLRDLMSFAIATYDERPDIYNYCAGRIFDEYIGAVGTYLSGGAHAQGPSYGCYRWVSLAWAELLFASMTGGRRIFGCLEKTADWFMYMTRPDGEDVRLGDDFNETKGEYNRRAPFAVPFFYAWALTGRDDFRDAFRQGLCREFLLPVHHGMDYYTEGSWGEGLISAVSLLIFDRFSPPRRTEPLPACRYFGTPVGMTVYKSGDTHVMLKAGEYWGGNHDHLDTGCFQLYRGGPLLTDSGVYDSYHTPHRLNYLTRTAAHNCLTVEMPGKPLFGEFSAGRSYDGGTRRPACGKEPRTPEDFMSDEYRMAEIVSHSESDSGCELTADLSRAYLHSCSRVIRSMSYDAKEGLLRVVDDVTSLSPYFRKTLHLHVQSEPVIDGSVITVRGKEYTAEIRVVSPAGAVIKKRGGPGHEFEIDGTNYPPEPPYVAEAGWGEITVSPGRPSLRDVTEIEVRTFKNR